jgi:putative FmdB family regulatory protein
MPIYEYTCRSCGQPCEIIVLPGTVPACPSCQSQDLERQLSPFAVSSDATRQTNLQRARKLATRASRDRLIADREAEIEHHNEHLDPEQHVRRPEPKPIVD